MISDIYISIHSSVSSMAFALPIFIFFARCTDVSLDTFRIITISKGMKGLAALIAFFQMLIWITALGQVIHNLNSWLNIIAYAGGFSAGTYVGLKVDQRIALGRVLVTIITKLDATQLIDFLKQSNLGVTSVDAQGASGNVKIIYTVINRKDLNFVLSKLHLFNPNAFYSIEDVRSAAKGIFPNYPKKYLRWLGLGKGEH